MTEEKKKETPSVGGAAFGLADAVLKNKTVSNKLAWVVGVIIVLAIGPILCVGGPILFFVARTSAWAVWLTLGIILGAGGVLAVQYLQRHTQARPTGVEEEEVAQ